MRKPPRTKQKPRKRRASPAPQARRGAAPRRRSAPEQAAPAKPGFSFRNLVARILARLRR